MLRKTLLDNCEVLDHSKSMDVPTLLFGSILAAFVLGILFLVLAMTQKVHKGAYFWVFAFFSSGLGLGLLSTQGHWDPFFSIILANLLIWSSPASLLFGLRRYLHLPWAQPYHCLYLVFHLAGFILFTYVFPSVPARVTVLALGVIAVSVETLAVVVPKTKEYALMVRVLVTGLLASSIVMYLIRFVDVLLNPVPVLVGSTLGGLTVFGISRIILVSWAGSIFLLHTSRVQHELLRANKDLKGLNALKDQILTLTAHDLRGPMGTLRELWSLVWEKARSGECLDVQMPLFEAVNQSLEGTQSLIDNLFSYSQFQQELGFKKEKMGPREPLDLEKLCRDVISQLAPQASQKGIGLKLEKQGVEIPELFLDLRSDDLLIILRNLGANAVKFSRQGQDVKFVVKATDRSVLIKVCDLGVGMNKALQRQLLDPGHVVSRSGTAGEKGSGFGLVLVKELVKSNGGLLRFESEEGAGTQVLLEFPFSS